MTDQALLKLISSTFALALSSSGLQERLQSLKTHLHNRSFVEAFPTSASPTQDDSPEDDQHALLESYVVRWVPTRALCYARIFERILKLLPQSELRAALVGAGCGSESLALQASYRVNMDVVDSCPGWSCILPKLTAAANSMFNPAIVAFHHANIVSEFSKVQDIFSGANLVTLMFTLNEMITVQGNVATTKFLVELIKTLPQDSFILIVDSPTYSVIEIGGRRFPVSFLVHKLPGLEKIWEVESEWFRLDKELDYPIQLENMRYFGMLMKKKGCAPSVA